MVLMSVLFFVVDIKERMEDFEDSQLVKVPIKKLFILVPDSMYTPQSFSSDSMVISRNLEPLRVRRAGNVSRSYDNTMYKLTNTDWYAAIEGASPLQTVYESMEADPRLKHLRKEILASFVKALRRLLWDDLKCRNLCEVVQVNGELDLKSIIFIMCSNGKAYVFFRYEWQWWGFRLREIYEKTDLGETAGMKMCHFSIYKNRNLNG